MMDNQEIKEILKQIPIFYPLDDKELGELAGKLTSKTYKKSEIIYKEGGEGGNLYILVSGKLCIRSKGKIVNYLGRRGDFVGEHSIMNDTRHSVTVEVAMDSEVFILNKKDFDDIISKKPEIGFQISRILSDRLQERYEEETLKEKTIISVYSGNRKAGTSILAINLASGIKKDTEKNVILIDLCALENGSASDLLHLDISKEKLNNLAGKVNMLSSSSIENYIVTSKYGIKIFNHVLSKDDIIPLISLLHENYDYIIFDLPHVLTENTVRILEQSDKILFVCIPEEEALTKSISDLRYLSDTLNIPVEKIKIGQICVREEDRTFVYKVEDAVCKHIDFHLVFEPRAVRESIETGVPFVLSNPSLLISQNIKNIIRDLTGKKIGIALGSGSARGFAHIGVLKVLKREGIPVDLISGTSMGAFIGSMFASGISPETMEKIALKKLPGKKSILSFLDMVIPKTGFINGIRIINFLKSVIGSPLFLDLKIPLIVVASDLGAGIPVVIRSGSVLEAVRASISLPGIFEPYKVNNRLLVDGGITEPVPVRALKERGANKIIAVDVVPEKDRSSFINEPRIRIFDVVGRIMEIMGSESAKRSAEGADIVIKPETSLIGAFEFHRIPEIIKAGEVAAEESMPFLKELLKR